MKVTVHSAALKLKAVQDLVSKASPRDYLPAVRNWLLSGPKFSEFEGFSRFLERPGYAAKFGRSFRVNAGQLLAVYTPRPVATALRAALLAHGVAAVCHEADYGAFDTELLSDDSATLAFNPSMCLICTGHHHVSTVHPRCLRRRRRPGAPGRTRIPADPLATHPGENRRYATPARILPAGALPRPAVSTTSTRGAEDRFFRALERSLWNRDGRDIRVVAVDDLQQRVGSERWWSSRWYHVGKLPFNPDKPRDYATLLYAHVAAVRGTSRKCLDRRPRRHTLGRSGRRRRSRRYRAGQRDRRGRGVSRILQLHTRTRTAGVILGVVEQERYDDRGDGVSRAQGNSVEAFRFCGF